MPAGTGRRNGKINRARGSRWATRPGSFISGLLRLDTRLHAIVSTRMTRTFTEHGDAEATRSAQSRVLSHAMQILGIYSLAKCPRRLGLMAPRAVPPGLSSLRHPF